MEGLVLSQVRGHWLVGFQEDAPLRVWVACLLRGSEIFDDGCLMNQASHQAPLEGMIRCHGNLPSIRL